MEIVTDSIVASDRVTNPSVLTREGAYPESRRAEIRESVQKQTTTIRRAFISGTAITVGTMTLGALTGWAMFCLLGSPSKVLVYALQAAGAAFVLGATLAEVGGSIMTWDRESIPEAMNKLLFHGLYVLGTFTFVLSVAWDAA